MNSARWYVSSNHKQFCLLIGSQSIHSETTRHDCRSICETNGKAENDTDLRNFGDHFRVIQAKEKTL